MKILSILEKTVEKKKLNFSRNTLFHIKTRVCLKYFVNGCSYIYKPLTLIINQSLKTSTFPNNAKGAVVTPLDKGSLDENDVNNSRLVSVLNCFSKIFENIMKGQLIPFLKNHLSVFLSAYRSSYSSQHVLIRLMEEWRQNLDSDHIFRAVLMDLTKAFHLIEFHMIFS